MSMKSTVPHLVAIIAATALWPLSANSQSTGGFALDTFVGHTIWSFDTCMQRMEEILRGEGFDGFINGGSATSTISAKRGTILANMMCGPKQVVAFAVAGSPSNEVEILLNSMVQTFKNSR